MSKWLGGAKLFEENSYRGTFFETQSSIYALKQIHSSIEDTFPQMIFLLGEPGSGKSFLLRYLAKYYEDKRECLIIENPFLTPIEFLKRVLNFAGVSPDSEDVDTLKEKAIETYRDKMHIIMIDEAQLTSAPLREFIRILSDSKVFWFLIAMHSKEGEGLLKSPHFHSRPHKVIYMGDLQSHECRSYLQKTLQGSELWDFIIGMGDKLIQKSWNYSKGNFRNFKKLYYHLFLLLDYAYENNKKEFVKPNGQILEMAAIKAGLIEGKKPVQDFDELLSHSTAQNGSLILKLASVILLSLVLGYGGWHFFERTMQTDSVKISVKSEDSHLKKEVKTPNKVSKNQTEDTLEKKSVKTIPNEPKKSNKKLTFYPPNTTTSQVKSSQKIEVFQNNNQEELVAEYESMAEQEPNFLDDLVEENADVKTLAEPIRKEPILKLSRAKPMSIQMLADRFLSHPTYQDALKIANLYYEKRDYKNAASWAKKANQLDKEQEDAWIVFAKSQYNQGNKKNAKAALKLFLDYKSSQKAKILLDKWSS